MTKVMSARMNLDVAQGRSVNGRKGMAWVEHIRQDTLSRWVGSALCLYRRDGTALKLPEGRIDQKHEGDCALNCQYGLLSTMACRSEGLAAVRSMER
jgi:hypothetical protein